MLTIKVLLIAAFCCYVSALGEKCTTNGGCGGSNVYCKIGSPTCGAGVCSCIPGFAVDKNDGACKRAVAIGGTCSASDVCKVEHTSCVGGVCQCNRGYKRGPKGNDCVAASATEVYRGKCYDSIQCYYNMKCIDNQCGCFEGYSVISGYECKAREIGDVCSSDQDCIRSPNTACSGGTCQCMDGYKRISYMVSATETKLACVDAAMVQVGEGGACNTTIDSRGEGKICARPFVCTQCESEALKCGRIAPLLAGAERRGPIFATIVMLVAVIFAI